jgi:nicotinamidase-related amidase
MKYLSIILLIIFNVSCASNVDLIDNYNNPQKALLVIDMQIDYIDKNGRYPIDHNQIENLIITTNNIIDEFAKNEYIIIYLRNIFRKSDIKNIFRNYAVVEGTQGAGIDPRINVVSGNIYDKYKPDAFSSKDFNNFLMQNQINELFLCGVMADECVYSTALSAVNRNYVVNYYLNAVGSSNDRNIENAARKLEGKGVKIIRY